MREHCDIELEGIERKVAPQGNLAPISLSLCIPCFNESAVIEDVLFQACEVLSDFESEIVVVDDGSTDGTFSILERFAATNLNVQVIRHSHNCGYGAAIASALRSARGKWCAIVDGDGQFNLLDLRHLLAATKTCDVVIGYRECRADNIVRRVSAFGWSVLTRLLFGLRVRDLDCAFKLLPHWVVTRLEMESKGACISAEILVQCIREGVTICEVAVQHFRRVNGKSTGATLGVIVRAFRELPIVWKKRGRPRWEVDIIRDKSDYCD